MTQTTGGNPHGIGTWPYVVAGVLYLPLVFLGFGSDNDTYQSLDAGRRVLQGRTYEPSRPPGYLIDEISWAVIAKAGGGPALGSVLCNVATLGFCLMALAAFARICSDLAIPQIPLLMLIFIVHPYVWVNADSTMDYFWALGPLLLAFVVLSRGWTSVAGSLSAFAIGARFTSALAVAVFFIYFFITRPDLRRRLFLVYAPLTIVPGLLCFWPSFEWAHHSLPTMLHALRGPSELWTAKLHVGRWGYKNIYFWGLPATALLMVIAVSLVRRPGGLVAPRWRAALLMSVAVITVYEGLFLAFPVESSYLLPTIPFALILLGVALVERPVYLACLAALIATQDFVRLDVAHPINPGHATGGCAGLWVEPGTLVDDIEMRLRVRGCETLECYTHRLLERAARP